MSSVEEITKDPLAEGIAWAGVSIAKYLAAPKSFAGPPGSWGVRPVATNGRQVEKGDVIVIQVVDDARIVLPADSRSDPVYDMSCGNWLATKDAENDGGQWLYVATNGPAQSLATQFVVREDLGVRNEELLCLQLRGTEMGVANHGDFVNCYPTRPREFNNRAVTFMPVGDVYHMGFRMAANRVSCGNYLNVKSSAEPLSLLVHVIGTATPDEPYISYSRLQTTIKDHMRCVPLDLLAPGRSRCSMWARRSQ